DDGFFLICKGQERFCVETLRNILIYLITASSVKDCFPLPDW
ncbi:hypothetical protein CFOL_v3_02366, partial [Cephalotus follicularis]